MAVWHGAGSIRSANIALVMYTVKITLRIYYKSIATCAGKVYRDGAVVPFE